MAMRLPDLRQAFAKWIDCVKVWDRVGADVHSRWIRGTIGNPVAICTQGIGYWSSASILSMVFMLLHAFLAGESALGLCQTRALGMVFCLSLWYTKSLFWAVGFYAGRDWSEILFLRNAGQRNVDMRALVYDPPGRGSSMEGGGHRLARRTGKCRSQIQRDR